VDTSGVGNTFAWTTPNINGLTASSAAPYLLWNFSNATQLTISGSQTVPGTVYAPGTAVSDYDSNGLAGAVIAASLAVGGSGGTPNGGQILSYPFAVSLSVCSVQQLTISLTADTAAAVPGGTVHYTVTATNSGTTAYTGATFTDSLSNVLDDASYNSDASATAGSVAFTSPNLTWTGNLAAGATATITFSVTVNNPDTGNKTLANTITSATADSNCASGSTDSRCSSSVPVQGLTITATASIGSTTPGSTVGYTITVTNSGQAGYTGASLTDSLSGVLDDAAYNGDATATAGSVSFASPNLTWTGTLAAGAAATVTFTATVSNPDTGDKILTNALTSASAGSNCGVGSTDPACSSTVTVSSLAITNSSNVTSATPGSVVRFTATFTNTGQTPYNDITIATNAADVFDDAVPNGDQTATSGTLTIVGAAVTWTGSIPVGGTVTVSGTVTVNNPDVGNHTLASAITTAAAGSNCPSAAPAAACSVSVPVLTPGLTITNTPSTTTPQPGSVISYTLTITDTGQTAYTGISVAESFAEMADDASYDGNAAATTGTLSFASPVLTWTGDLAPGASATVTFSVTVHNPDTGDKLVIITGTSAAPGSACPPGTTAGHRQQDPRGHAHLDLAGQQLPGVRVRSGRLLRHRHRADPGPEHHQDGRRQHDHAGLGRALHDHRGRHRPDPIHRRDRHRRPVRRARRRGLQRECRRQHRHRLPYQPEPDLDR
jgi:large repetitive protein